MAIIDRHRQARYTEVGRIRCGLAPGASGNDKRFPVSIDHFRFTSPSRDLIEAIAQRYGGTPTPWRHPGNRSNQFEVITKTSDIPVDLPPQNVEPWYELWGGNQTCMRRCDGEVERLRSVEDRIQRCLCDPTGAMERGDPNRECQITIRMIVRLTDFPTMGVWHLASHGWSATDEWDRYNELLRRLPENGYLPCRLLLERRTSNNMTWSTERGREELDARRYVVPTLLFDVTTVQALVAGQDVFRRMISGIEEQRATLYAPPAAAAITDGRESRAPGGEPAAPSQLELRLRERIAEAMEHADPEGEYADIWRQAKAARLTSLLEPLRELRAALAALAATTTPEPEAAVEGDAAAVIDAVVLEDPPAGVDEPEPAGTRMPDDPMELDRQDQFNRLIALAGQRGWRTSDVTDVVKAFTRAALSEATAEQIRYLVDAMGSGRLNVPSDVAKLLGEDPE